jgi:hypothetical protein
MAVLRQGREQEEAHHLFLVMVAEAATGPVTDLIQLAELVAELVVLFPAP